MRRPAFELLSSGIEPPLVGYIEALVCNLCLIDEKTETGKKSPQSDRES